MLMSILVCLVPLQVLGEELSPGQSWQAAERHCFLPERSTAWKSAAPASCCQATGGGHQRPRQLGGSIQTPGCQVRVEHKTHSRQIVTSGPP